MKELYFRHYFIVGGYFSDLACRISMKSRNGTPFMWTVPRLYYEGLTKSSWSLS